MSKLILAVILQGTCLILCAGVMGMALTHTLTTTFKRNQGRRSQNVTGESIIGSRLLECARGCARIESCLAINYNKDAGICQYVQLTALMPSSSSQQEPPQDLIEDVQWDLWAKKQEPQGWLEGYKHNVYFVSYLLYYTYW